MVLVTLGGCHLLDGLVACDSVKAHEKIVRCSEGEFVRGIVLTPWGSRICLANACYTTTRILTEAGKKP